MNYPDGVSITQIDRWWGGEMTDSQHDAQDTLDAIERLKENFRTDLGLKIAGTELPAAKSDDLVEAVYEAICDHFADTIKRCNEILEG